MAELTPLKPFLKWAGCKFRLMDKLLATLPPGKRLIEPFVGSGAVFLNAKYPKYLLGEKNQDLVTLYHYLQEEGQDFIDYARQFYLPKNNDKARYIKYRAQFNETDDTRLRSALFIYMNRHCYNGLTRYNSSGIYNVPFGSQRDPRYHEDELQEFCKRAKKATFVCQDFTKTMKQAKKGDVVYCDPPYVPLSKTANFTNYSGNVFVEENQIELMRQAEILADRGIPVIISNHDTPFTRKLYKNAEITSFPVRRYISRDSATRVNVSEVIAVFR